MTLLDRVKQAAAFLTGRPNVGYVPAAGDITLASDLALLVIDVQKEFCDPKGNRGNAETDEVSHRIKRLVPEFRKAGIPTYVIYFSDKPKKASRIDFYAFTPEDGDMLIAKNRDSAFRGSNIKDILTKHQRKSLLACGFNLNACVRDTVLDAVRCGFDVHLLRDLTGNDNDNDGTNAERYVEEMKRSGVHVTNAHDELRKLGANNVSAPSSPSP